MGGLRVKENGKVGKLTSPICQRPTRLGCQPFVLGAVAAQGTHRGSYPSYCVRQARHVTVARLVVSRANAFAFVTEH